MYNMQIFHDLLESLPGRCQIFLCFPSNVLLVMLRGFPLSHHGLYPDEETLRLRRRKFWMSLFLILCRQILGYYFEILRYCCFPNPACLVSHKLTKYLIAIEIVRLKERR